MLASFHFSSRIEEFAADCILVKRIYPKAVVPMIVREFPKATGLDAVFALVSIADSVRIWLPKDQFERDLPTMIFKACGMLSADLFALEKLGICPVTCHEIEEFWGEEEGYFVLAIP